MYFIIFGNTNINFCLYIITFTKYLNSFLDILEKPFFNLKEHQTGHAPQSFFHEQWCLNYHLNSNTITIAEQMKQLKSNYNIITLKSAFKAWQHINTFHRFLDFGKKNT